MQNHIFFSCALLLLITGCNSSSSSSPSKPSQNKKSLPSLERLRNADLSIKPRVVVLTDFGEDPDDEQSMVRFLLYANEFDIEGLLVTADGSDDNLEVQDDLLIEYLDRYDAVQANLSNHAEGYPMAGALKKLVKPDKWMLGKEAQVGAEHQTPASEHIISVVDRDDTRPIWFIIWGGPRPLSQALWKVKQDRSPAQYQEFLKKIRIYSIEKQDPTFDWLEQNATSAFAIINATGGKPQQTFRGMYLTGDTKTVKSKWLKKNIIENHSSLGAIYPPDGAGVPGMKEGDTPSLLYLLSQSVGLSNIAFPSQGGWGGRFLPSKDAWYSDEYALDRLDGEWDRRHSVSRWRNDFNRDFAARMDWSTTSDREAVNHPPQPRVKVKNKSITTTNDKLPNQIIITARANETIVLDAAGSTDSDGNNVDYDWLYYAEAGNYDGKIKIDNSTQSNASLTLPADWQQGHQIHVVLRVTDSGSPPLTRYRRIIIVSAEPAATKNIELYSVLPNLRIPHGSLSSSLR